MHDRAADGSTILFSCTSAESLGPARFCLQHGVDPLIKNSHGQYAFRSSTPLHQVLLEVGHIKASDIDQG